MIRKTKRIREILERLSKMYPSPRTELEFETPFQLLVATMLAAQSTDRQVNKVTARLFDAYGTPETMATLRAEQLEPWVSSVGLYRNKSRAIVETARIIMGQYGGDVPKTREELESLPGVGRKTANVVLSNAFDIPAFAVDTHVFRVARRLGLSDGKNPLEVEQDLCRLIEPEDWKDAHHWLIFHGRRVCAARSPRCGNCGLEDLCRSGDKVKIQRN